MSIKFPGIGLLQTTVAEVFVNFDLRSESQGVKVRNGIKF